MSQFELILPDLGLGNRPIVVSLWLVQPGTRVSEGEPVVEILAGPVVVDLPAPVDGVLVETLVSEDEPLVVGQPLAVIRSDENL
jgi:pyruvate/2-oxoglutarate dehydrogenase complex dihydrolipoamide acyltransferase (E2) component